CPPLSRPCASEFACDSNFSTSWGGTGVGPPFGSGGAPGWQVVRTNRVGRSIPCGDVQLTVRIRPGPSRGPAPAGPPFGPLSATARGRSVAERGRNPGFSESAQPVPKAVTGTGTRPGRGGRVTPLRRVCRVRRGRAQKTGRDDADRKSVV